MDQDPCLLGQGWATLGDGLTQLVVVGNVPYYGSTPRPNQPAAREVTTTPGARAGVPDARPKDAAERALQETAPNTMCGLTL